MKQFEYIVTGRVQGVGFRYYVHKKANELGLKGWVKNTVDGHVQVMAQGDESVLDTLVDYLYVGPPLARIDKISKVETQLSSVFHNFSVKY